MCDTSSKCRIGIYRDVHASPAHNIRTDTIPIDKSEQRRMLRGARTTPALADPAVGIGLGVAVESGSEIFPEVVSPLSSAGVGVA
jgi:hypothetical protein